MSEVRVAAVHDGRVDSVDDVGEKKYGKVNTYSTLTTRKNSINGLEYVNQ